MKITLKGDPVSTNSIYKYRLMGKFIASYISKRGKDIKASYMQQLQEQYKGDLIHADINMSVDLYFGNKRIHDIDNYNKLLLDACTGIVWKDDSQIQSMKISKYYDKENPRIELVLL